MALNFSLNGEKLWKFQNIPNFEGSYSPSHSRNFKILKKNSKKNSKNLQNLKVRMLVNMGPSRPCTC